MNRAQLDALLAAGLIDEAAYVTAIVTLAGGTAPAPAIDLHVMTPAVRLDVESDSEGAPTGGVLRADTVTRYDELIESHNMIIHAGALVPRQPLVKNKILRDHNHAEPVGYMLDVDDAGQAASWQIASTEIARVQQEFDEHLRDGLSVGLTIHEYEIDADWVLHVYRGDWYETSLCAIPAVQEAGVASVAAALATARKENHTMNRAQLAAALAAGRITQEQHDAALAALTVTETLATPPAPTVPAELAAGPADSPAPTGRAHTQERGLSLSMAVDRIVEAATTPGASGSAVALAIEQITGTSGNADDAGEAFTRPEWVGEVWQAEAEGRPWIDSLGPVKPLTSQEIEGYAWDETPVPEKYDGDLTEVPSNGFSTRKVTAEPDRWAWAARVDRIFRDLGTPDLAASLLGKCTKNYERVSDFDVAAKVLAAATVPTVGQPGAIATPHTSVLGAVGAIARDFRTIGAKLDQIWLAEDLFEAWSEMKIADLPAWLALSLGVSLTEGKSIAGNLTIEADAKMTNGTIAGYDKRAVSVYEKGPITLEALVIPNGGIDIGWFSYGGILVNDKRAIEKRYVDLTEPVEA